MQKAIMAMALLALWEEQLRLTLFHTILISLLILTSILFLRKFTRGNKLNLPPSPPKLPIIGNLHQLGTLPHHSLQALSKKYGPVILLQLGHAPTLVVTCADIAKEIFKSHDIVFSNRPKTTAAKYLLYGCSDLAFSPYGDYWRQARKVCVLELLSVKRVQSFQFVREEEVAMAIDMVRCRTCNTNGGSVDLAEMLLVLTNNIASRCVLGRKYEEEDGKNRFAELSRKIMVQFMTFSVGDFFPSLGWIDVLTGLIPRLKETFTEFDTLFDTVIEEHKSSKSKNPSNKKDFVDILLQLQMDNLLDFELTQDKLKGILLDMFVGGTETTSTTMEWAMTELVRNPTTMKKLQEEVRGVVGKKSKVDVSDINQMGYLKCVIKEALRLHSPVSLLVPRETAASVKLGGYDIPAKTRVFVNTWAIQRDPELWERAEEFVPERFENDSSIDFKDQDFQFIAFGGGRRGCPGMSFGLVTAEYVIANLLCWFDWQLPSGVTPENLDMREVYGLTVQKKVPLHLVPVLPFVD